MSDLKMSSYEVIDHPERKLCDFLPKDLVIINRSGLPDPLTLEIVKCSNWMQVIDVHGDTRDAKLVLKALTSYDSNQELIAKQQDRISRLEQYIENAGLKLPCDGPSYQVEWVDADEYFKVNITKQQEQIELLKNKMARFVTLKKQAELPEESCTDAMYELDQLIRKYDEDALAATAKG